MSDAEKNAAEIEAAFVRIASISAEDAMLLAQTADEIQTERLARITRDHLDAVARADIEPDDDWQEDGRRSADMLGRALLASMSVLAIAALAVTLAWVGGWVA